MFLYIILAIKGEIVIEKLYIRDQEELPRLIYSGCYIGVIGFTFECKSRKIFI